MSETYQIAGRDWESVLSGFTSTAPYNYVILDDFLEPDSCRRVHQELLQDSGWVEQKHNGRALHSNMRPKTRATVEIAAQVIKQCPKFFGGYDLVDNWALLYPENAPRTIHSDVGALTLNVWLTPDEYNLDPARGGLIFYDVKRRLPESPNDDVLYSWSEQYLNDNTGGNSVSVSYRWNRALLFDARTFHRTDDFQFVNRGRDSLRMNLSFTFDDPHVFAQVSQTLRGGAAKKSQPYGEPSR